MKRVKSAPANIAEMVNRKKPAPLSSASNLVLLCKTQTQEAAHRGRRLPHRQ
jgi:hypothetical protein